MGSDERISADDPFWRGEDIHPAHFYAAYLFEQPETHDKDITAVVTKAKELGYPTRFWWLSEVVNLEGQADQLIVGVHHTSFVTDPGAGMDLYQALEEQEVSWSEFDGASAAEYLMLGRPLNGLEDVRTSDRKLLFPHENPAVVEWTQTGEELTIRLEVVDQVMDTLTPTERDKLRHAVGQVVLFFSAVLAHKETLEQAGGNLETTLEFLAEYFAVITQAHERDMSQLSRAVTQELYFSEPVQDADYASDIGSLVAATQQDQADVIVETAFAAWMGKVDEIVFDMAGCSVHDLPDIDFRTFFETAATPYQAADAALLNAGFSGYD